MLRCADPSLRGGVTGLDLAGAEELSRAFEPCLNKLSGIAEQPAKADNEV